MGLVATIFFTILIVFLAILFLGWLNEKRDLVKHDVLSVIVVSIGLIVFIWIWHHQYVNSTKYKVSQAIEADRIRQIHLDAQINRIVRSKLVDPDSAQFRNQSGKCGEVNAKNRMGGYTGFKRYVVLSEELAFIEGAMDQNSFEQVYSSAKQNNICKP